MNTWSELETKAPINILELQVNRANPIIRLTMVETVIKCFKALFSNEPSENRIQLAKQELTCYNRKSAMQKE